MIEICASEAITILWPKEGNEEQSIIIQRDDIPNWQFVLEDRGEAEDFVRIGRKIFDCLSERWGVHLVAGAMRGLTVELSERFGASDIVFVVGIEPEQSYLQTRFYAGFRNVLAPELYLNEIPWDDVPALIGVMERLLKGDIPGE